MRYLMIVEPSLSHTRNKMFFLFTNVIINRAELEQETARILSKFLFISVVSNMILVISLMIKTAINTFMDSFKYIK